MRRIVAILVLLAGSCLSSWAAEITQPKDAVGQIFCRTFTGPTRVADAQLFRDMVARETGLKGFHLLHSEQESTLYYGYYRSFDLKAEDGKDRKDAERAHEDLKKLKELKEPDGKRLFPMVLPQPIDQVGNEGPPEWNIANTPPAKAHWSLLVAAYRDNPERKKAAVDAVTALRKDGIEAYYVHGPQSSLVLIGTWPKDSVDLFDPSGVANNDPNVELVVANFPLPKGEKSRVQQLDNGKKRIWVAPEIAVPDKTLRNAMDRYPEFALNGQVFFKRMKDPRTGREDKIPERSVLYKIERGKSNSILGNRPAHAEALEQLRGGSPGGAGGAGGAGGSNQGGSGLRRLGD